MTVEEFEKYLAQLDNELSKIKTEDYYEDQCDNIELRDFYACQKIMVYVDNYIYDCKFVDALEYLLTQVEPKNEVANLILANIQATKESQPNPRDIFWAAKYWHHHNLPFTRNAQQYFGFNSARPGKEWFDKVEAEFLGQVSVTTVVKSPTDEEIMAKYIPI